MPMAEEIMFRVLHMAEVIMFRVLPMAEVIMCCGFLLICMLEETIHHFIHPHQDKHSQVTVTCKLKTIPPLVSRV